MVRSTKYAHISLLSVGVIYSLNYFVAKGLMPGKIGPSGFIVLRVIGGGLMFLLLRILLKFKLNLEII